MPLHNRIAREELLQQFKKDDTKRVTLSFYKYHKLKNPEFFRDYLYLNWEALGVLGRTYVAEEGINSQISVPEKNWELFKEHLYSIDFLDGIRLNVAADKYAKSFFKLQVKLKPKILADGLNDETFNPGDGGTHLNADEFNELVETQETVIIDMRNHYESEIGHFENAVRPDVDTFRDSLPVIADMLEEHKGKHIVMYCTGGIRCEKASAWFKHLGHENVYQLNGGIIEYFRQVNQKDLDNKFIGKNFVFDERLGERISDDVIAVCHQCGEPCDDHTNCANVACNLLFIQCDACKAKMENCCSKDCQEIIHLPEEEQRELRKGKVNPKRYFKKGRSEKLPFKQ